MCVCVCLCVHTLIHIHIYFECISFRQIQKYQIECYFCVRKVEFFLLFNDALKTFYLWLYGIRHMIKDHLDDKSIAIVTIVWATLSD